MLFAFEGVCPEAAASSLRADWDTAVVDDREAYLMQPWSLLEGGNREAIPGGLAPLFLTTLLRPLTKPESLCPRWLDIREP